MSDPKEVKDESKITIPEVKNGLDQLTGSMPEVVPDAVASAKAAEDQVKNTLDEFTDAAGTRFDPNIHSVDADGNPKVSSITGKLKCKPGARFKKPGESFINLKSEDKKVEEDPKKLKVHAAAVQFADSFIAAGVMVVGDEWKDHPGERDTLIDANERVFDKYGVVEIHPIANITVVYGLYIFKRVMKPQSKSQQIWNHVCKKTGETFKKAGEWFKYTILRKPRPSHNKPQPKEKENAESSKTVHA
jgi:hypothetical protein